MAKSSTASSSLNLLSSQNRIQIPYIQVTIGDYTFGVVNQTEEGYRQYPNYVQSLQVTKINGMVNTYELSIVYQIRAEDDPNYFEKVFSSVSTTRKITFTYGDLAAANYLYKQEEAIITKVQSSFSLDTSSIRYTVTAVSSAILGTSGYYPFPESYDKQPSTIIWEILNNPLYGLLDLFPGMRNLTKVGIEQLIPQNDVITYVERKDGISPLEYLQYLVDCMNSTGTNGKPSIYVLTYMDDTTGEFGGAYFKITQVDSAISHPEAYILDLGFPGNNLVYNYQCSNDEQYSIFYEYQEQLHPQEYVSRIGPDGEYQEEYAPNLLSHNAYHQATDKEKAWWAKVSQYPIKASVQIKGLLRPATLMSYVRLNIWLYGKKHINSGLYIVTKQVDNISGDGYSTTLNLQKIGEDEDTTTITTTTST